MSLGGRIRGRRRRFRLGPGVRLRLEPLETRTVLSAAAVVPEVEPNDTMDQAQSLTNDLSMVGQVAATGVIGNGTSKVADVDWYDFTLTSPAEVRLTTLGGQAGPVFPAVLSLYGNDPNDPVNPIFNYRLLAQGDVAAGTGVLDLRLDAGTYSVAVSGSGNRWFNPLLADSGLPGATGSYTLSLSAASLTVAPADPIVLRTDPADGSVIDHAPLVIRLSTTGALPNADTVQVVDTNNQVVALTGPPAFNPQTNEFEIVPAQSLAPGSYRISVLDAGNAEVFASTFTVSGTEGIPAVTGPDDVPAGAHQLGDISDGRLMQIAGAIGDDPFHNQAYSPSNGPDPSNPAADVDLYHFRITGLGPHGLIAEAFAGRIGSPLDPALSLFRLDPQSQQLVLVSSNDSTLNSTQATDQSLPLYVDAALFAGLTAGDYYLAVSGSGNMPDSSSGLLPGTNGIFDPNVSHSGQNGFSLGDYVLNLQVESSATPPHVSATTPGSGNVLRAPPTTLTVRFDKPVNLQQLAYQAFLQFSQATPSSVFIQPVGGGQHVVPRLQSYDPTTGQASFLMLDGLANGDYELHVSGPLGISDFDGNALAANDVSGDYVVRFTVAGPSRGTNGDPLQWTASITNGDPAQPQDLGVLFPREIQNGVAITRDFTADHQADYYRIQVLQDREYHFALGGSLPPGTAITVIDSTGKPRPPLPWTPAGAFFSELEPGIYVIKIGGWSPSDASSVSYTLHITLLDAPENPTPLTAGPAPALRLRLVTNTPPGNNTTGSGASGGTNTPVGGSSTGIFTIAAPGIPIPVGTGSSADNATPSFLPADMLRALAAGPVGGAFGGERSAFATAPDRLLVQLPGPGFVEGLLQLTILAQPAGTEDSGAARPITTSPMAFDAQSFGQLMRSWSEFLDFFFRMGNGPDEITPPAPGLDPAPEEVRSERHSEPVGCLMPLGDGDGSSASMSSPSCLVALGLMGSLYLERKRQRRDDARTGKKP